MLWSNAHAMGYAQKYAGNTYGPLGHVHGLEVMRYISHAPQISARARNCHLAKEKSEWLLCSVTCFTGAIAQRTSW